MDQLVSIVFVSYDWVMQAPIPNLDPQATLASRERLNRVPVIRVFGHHQDSGQQCCLFVHCFFPSLLIQMPPSIDRLIEALETARSVINGDPVVYEIQVERKTDIYGYHDSPVEMVRLYCVNPADIAKVASLVQERFPQLRVYEVHIPYLLQFLITRGLQGVSPLVLDASMLKHSRPSDKATSCKLELHAHVNAIRNDQAKKVSQSQSATYVKPKPLVTSSTDLICGSCLDTVWEEEARRYPDKPFPYIPEGIESGQGRPVAADISHCKHRIPDVTAAASSSDFLSTQMILDNLANLPNPSQQSTLLQTTNPDAYEYPPTVR
jgi:DNA polymerase family B, exonuclease domain